MTGARNVRTYLADVTGFLRLNYGLLVGMFSLLSRAPPLRVALRWMVSGSLWLMRAVLLRGVSSRLELTAIAGRGTPRELARTLEFDDGQEAVALGAAAVVARALERGDSLPTGVYAVPERFSLAELLAVIEGITGRQVRGDGLL